MMGLAEPEMRVTGWVCVGQAGTLVLCSFAARKLVPGQQNFQFKKRFRINTVTLLRYENTNINTHIKVTTQLP